MSKAFTDEESRDATVLGRAVERAERGEERPITLEGHRSIVEELRRLSEEERPAVMAIAGEVARDARRAELEHRIALLSATLESVRVVELPREDDGRVRFGSTVTIGWGSGRRQVVRIVGPDEVDARSGRISVDSPIARALLGLAAGDTVEVELPRGAEEATVIAVARS